MVHDAATVNCLLTFTCTLLYTLVKKNNLGYIFAQKKSPKPMVKVGFEPEPGTLRSKVCRPATRLQSLLYTAGT